VVRNWFAQQKGKTVAFRKNSHQIKLSFITEGTFPLTLILNKGRPVAMIVIMRTK